MLRTDGFSQTRYRMPAMWSWKEPTISWLMSSPGPETPVAATPPSVSLTSLTWSRVPHSEEAFGDAFEQIMLGVTFGGPGMVAVGSDGSPGDCEGRAAVWSSVDGIAWSRVPHSEAVFGEAQMTGVTVGGPGLVAVGHASGRTVDAAAVWSSVDGITWSRVRLSEAVFGGGATMWNVTAGGPGLVAVGWDGHPHGETSNAVVWTSVDGMTWSKVPDTNGVFSQERGQWMWSVTKGGPGLVAVGYDSSGAAVWTSQDGFNWSKAPHNKTIFKDAEMRGVTAGGPGLVAVGSGWNSEASNAMVWTSADGIAWSRVPHNEAVFGGAHMSSVTPEGQGLVAVGGSGLPKIQQGQVWTSPDGMTWSRVPSADAVFGTQKPELPVLEMRSITASGSRLVAVGANTVHDTVGRFTRADAAVWVAVPEE
jgi:hypothetical protein